MSSKVSEKEGRDLLEYLRIIWRKKWLVLLVVVSVFGAVMWHTYRSRAVYVARVTVQLNFSGGPPILDRLGGLFEGPKLIETEIEILRSRVIGERTAIRLQRHYSSDPLPAGVSVEFTDVRITNKVVPGAYVVTFVDDGEQYKVKDPRGSEMGVGRAGQPFVAGGLSFALSRVSAKAGSSVKLRIGPLAELGEAMRATLNVVPLRATNIIDLRVRMNDPQEAARTANAFAEAYVEFTREQNIQRLLSVREFLERQLVSFRQDFLRVGEELSKSSREGQETALGQMTLDSVKAEMAKRLVNLEMERIAMKFTYMPDHRALVQVEREIAEIRNRLTKQINPGKQDLPLLELLHGSQAKLGMYNYILQKQQEIRLAEAAELGSARIIDYAIAPKVPVSPNVSRNARVGGLLGLSLGIGLALFLNHLNRSVRNVKDVEEGVGLPVFGAIPNIGSEDGAETAKQWGRRRKVKDPAKLLLGIDSGRSYAVEAYRALRTRIRFAVPEASARVFLFTSAQPGEGKSLTVANLAIAMSRRGGRILVVDCDMRKPDQSKLFHVREESGISDVLVGRNTWREMTKPTRVNNVDLVPCGEIPEDPAELLAGPAMGQFLAEAEQHYDLVLLDSPPILPFTDASVLAPLVSGVFLVVRSGRTRAEAIARVRSILESIKAKLIAVVLNGVSPQDEIGYYPYAYYYGAYPASGKRRWFKRVARGVLSRFRRV